MYTQLKHVCHTHALWFTEKHYSQLGVLVLPFLKFGPVKVLILAPLEILSLPDFDGCKPLISGLGPLWRFVSLRRCGLAYIWGNKTRRERERGERERERGERERDREEREREGEGGREGGREEGRERERRINTEREKRGGRERVRERIVTRKREREERVSCDWQTNKRVYSEVSWFSRGGWGAGRERATSLTSLANSCSLNFSYCIESVLAQLILAGLRAPSIGIFAALKAAAYDTMAAIDRTSNATFFISQQNLHRKSQK
jgi:hypothetical protein